MSNDEHVPNLSDMSDDMPEVARKAAFEIHHDRLMREIEQLKKDRDWWRAQADRRQEDVRRLQATCDNEWASRVAELMRERDEATAAEWPTDRVRVVLDFDDDGACVTRKPADGTPVTTERVDLNATDNGGTLVVRTSGRIGYVFVVQKWEEHESPATIPAETEE